MNNTDIWTGSALVVVGSLLILIGFLAGASWLTMVPTGALVIVMGAWLAYVGWESR